jgi:hypothetical protein
MAVAVGDVLHALALDRPRRVPAEPRGREILALCVDAGLAGVGVLAVGGTKVHADASHHANRDYEQPAPTDPNYATATPKRDNPRGTVGRRALAGEAVIAP